LGVRAGRAVYGTGKLFTYEESFNSQGNLGRVKEKVEKAMDQKGSKCGAARSKEFCVLERYPKNRGNL